MNLKKSRLNNLKMGFQRNSVEYEAIMLDLYLVGILSKEAFESLTGRECPSYVNLPNGMKPIYCRPDEAEDVDGNTDTEDNNNTDDGKDDDTDDGNNITTDEEEEVNGTVDNSSDEGDSSTSDVD